MRILHVRNVAGVATGLSRAQRRLGHLSEVLVTRPHPYGYEEDMITNSTVRTAWKVMASDYDVYHLHSGSNLWRKYGQRIGRMLGKKVVRHLHGMNEVIEGDTGRVLVSMPNLLRVMKGGVWIPNPVEPEPFLGVRQEREDLDRMVVGVYESPVAFSNQYNPIEPAEEAVQRLERKGHRVTLKKLRALPHRQVPEFLAGIDVWLDKYGYDFYGILAGEAALSGCPVITQIGEFEMRYVSNCPFISLPGGLSRDGLVDELCAQLESLMEDEERTRLGERCRRYALSAHDPLVSARLCIGEYEKL